MGRAGSPPGWCRPAQGGTRVRPGPTAVRRACLCLVGTERALGGVEEGGRLRLKCRPTGRACGAEEGAAARREGAGGDIHDGERQAVAELGAVGGDIHQPSACAHARQPGGAKQHCNTGTRSDTHRAPAALAGGTAPGWHRQTQPASPTAAQPDCPRRRSGTPAWTCGPRWWSTRRRQPRRPPR